MPLLDSLTRQVDDDDFCGSRQDHQGCFEHLTHRFKISDSDPEVLHIYGVADACDCEWFVEISWSSGANTGTITIDDHGRPFRTVGVKDIDVVDLTPDYRNLAPATYPPHSPMP